MLQKLPIEVALSILAHLRLREIHAFQLVHSTWDAIVRENEVTVYMRAAINHGFARPGDTLEDAHWNIRKDGSSRVESWKEVFQRQMQLERNWDGRGQTPSYKYYENTLDDVHRFKLDERPGARLVISTHRNGGLRVTDMDCGERLWELSADHVRHYAHCEYEHNYLIFDRSHPHALEVWRLRSDADPSFSGVFSDHGNMGASTGAPEDDIEGELPQPHPHIGKEHGPHPSQFEAYDRSIKEDMRAEFVPWALFNPKYTPRAYRFVYPTLLAASEVGQRLYLFDAPSASVVEEIPIPPPGDPSIEEAADLNEAFDGAPGHVHINYVELGERHAFVCTPTSILILPRAHLPSSSSSSLGPSTGTRRVLRFPHADPSLRVPQLVKHWAARLVRSLEPAGKGVMSEFTITAPRESESSTAIVQLGLNRQIFTAVHVSPSGKDFVGITALGVMYIVRDFERVSQGEVSFADVTLRIDLGYGAYNVAYEYDRIFVQTQNSLFIINLHCDSPPLLTPRKHYGVTPPEPNVYPNLTVHKLVDFTSALPLRLISCLKLTRTAAWLDWSIEALEAVQQERRSRDPDGEGQEPMLPAWMEQEDLIPEAVEQDHPAARRTVVRIGFLPGDTPSFGELAGYSGDQGL